MRYIYLGLAMLFLGIGAIGVVLPILPTTPFLLLASFFFAKGSTRFHRWFLSTKLYQKHLDGFVRERAMTLRTKLSILLPVSAMLLFVIWLVDHWHVRLLIGCVMLFKYYYFFFRIRTIREVEA